MICYFCKKNVAKIDFKDVETLKLFLSPSAKIKGSKKTGLCAKHQRELARAVKRARVLGLLPFTSKHAI
ncbi:MAG: 30S ribosomal protein S18 [Candidatus Pacebacteria bacterium]|nr:30S ribosomal protein S18 [Candidatus Paceibacterota bacterium]MDD4875395.1 30S ribosomal protein S18 [Candidatus Paceibacterota bacterium]